MECPFCKFENIDGVDECERCHAALTDLSFAEDKSGIEYELLHRPLGELMTQDFVSVEPDAPIREVVGRLIQEKQHCAIIMEGDRISGVFTERDVLNKLADQAEGLDNAPVSRYMTGDPVTLKVDAPVAFGLNRMMVGGYRHIPIVDDGRLAGVVCVRDILRYLMQRFPDLAMDDVTA